MQTTYTDAAIDVVARQYAIKNNVSYMEAMRFITSTLRESQTATLQADWQQRVTAAPSEADLDAKARAYLLRHEVDYHTALRIVVAAGSNQPPAPTPDQLKNSRPGALEQRLRLAHGPATAMAQLPVSTANFAERVDMETTADAVSILQGQAIEIFRAGTHQAMDGQQAIFTPADVQLIANNYNPQKVSAPLVIGHPDCNMPAYGWVKAVQATPDGRLLMLADQINPTFAEAVKSGKFKKRSVSLYAPRAYNNPAPSGYYLRHVGWLGAMQPAISGLADVQFA